MTHEELVEAVAKNEATKCGHNWHCVCLDEKGPHCDCGDALAECREDEPDYDRSTREDFRKSAHETIKAVVAQAVIDLSGGHDQVDANYPLTKYTEQFRTGVLAGYLHSINVVQSLSTKQGTKT